MLRQCTMSHTFWGRLIAESGEVVLDRVRLKSRLDEEGKEPQHYPAVVVLGRDRLFEDEGFERLDDDTTLITYHERFTQWVEAPVHVAPDPYELAFQVEMRNAPFASVCADEDCDLSGGNAHVGPCDPCGCPARHAVRECPERMP